MAIYGCFWLCVTMYDHDHVWLYMTMNDYLLLNMPIMAVHGYVWLCLTMFNYVQLCKTMFDYVCTTKKLKRRQRRRNKTGNRGGVDGNYPL